MKKALTVLLLTMMIVSLLVSCSDSVYDGYFMDCLEHDVKFTATSGTVVVGMEISGDIDISLEYTTDAEWKTFIPGTTLIELTEGKSVRFRAGDAGNKSFFIEGSPDSYCMFSMVSDNDGRVSVSGDIMYLLDKNGKAALTEDYAFRCLFMDCFYIEDAGNLELSASTLSKGCYYSMFDNCINLVAAPELPATTLADSCYYAMFCGCESLKESPAIPAAEMKSFCCYYMFQGCKSLTKAAEISAETMASYCCCQMFCQCTSLTKAPVMHAETVADYCFYGMFTLCSSLTEVPELPAMTMAESCYSFMFAYCTSLTVTPELPATSLAEYCYTAMFQNCTNLTAVSYGLPATTLVYECYSQMFQNCTKLTSVPVLHAKTLASGCYKLMFEQCRNLSSVTMLATTVGNTADLCLQNFLYGAGSDVSGRTLYVDPLMTGNEIINAQKGYFTVAAYSQN